MNLYSHQNTSFELLQANDNFALLMEMGTGKTLPMLKDLYFKIKQGKVKNAVLIAPSGSYRNLYAEIQKWIPDVDAEVFVWVSSASKNKTDFDKFLAQRDKNRILIINIEALSLVASAREGVQEFLKHSPDNFVCVDESQCIKSMSSTRTKFILKIAPLAKYRRIMTGLVSPENPLNVYSQFYFLDPAILGFSNFFSFSARYSITRKMHLRNTRSINVVVGYKNLPELKDKIAQKSYRVRTEDVLDLPEKIYMPIREVELTDVQKRLYKEMKTQAIAQIKDTFITAQISATILTRLHQILMGHVTDEMGLTVEVPTNRVHAVLEILEDHQGKAIIWAPYPRLLEKIYDAIKDEYGTETVVEYWGRTNSNDRVDAVKRFQEDPVCRFFVSNQAVGGEGINLTEANLVIYAANSWKASERQQSEARAHRSGTKHTVTYIDIAANNTMEHKLINALRQKFDLAALVQGDNVKEWLT